MPSMNPINNPHREPIKIMPEIIPIKANNKLSDKEQ